MIVWTLGKKVIACKSVFKQLRPHISRNVGWAGSFRRLKLQILVHYINDDLGAGRETKCHPKKTLLTETEGRGQQCFRGVTFSLPPSTQVIIYFLTLKVLLFLIGRLFACNANIYFLKLKVTDKIQRVPYRLSQLNCPILIASTHPIVKVGLTQRIWWAYYEYVALRTCVLALCVAKQSHVANLVCWNFDVTFKRQGVTNMADDMLA